MTILERARQQLSNSHLEEVLGVKRTTIRKIEKGEIKKHDERVNKHLISLALGILERLKE